MKRTRHGVAAGLLLLPTLGLAQPSLDLQYSTFYSQMKTFAKGEFGHARLGFYLTDQQNGRRCLLTSARVSTRRAHGVRPAKSASPATARAGPQTAFRCPAMGSGRG